MTCSPNRPLWNGRRTADTAPSPPYAPPSWTTGRSPRAAPRASLVGPPQLADLRRDVSGLWDARLNSRGSPLTADSTRCGAGDHVVTGSLYRSVTHALTSAGRYQEAVRLTEDAAAYLEPGLSRPSPEFLSVYGTLFLAGSMAAARDDDRSTTRTFLATVGETARRFGHDANHLWTAFGPTNVAIHQVATAAELGDVQVAIDLGPQIDTLPMPMERRVRHALEVSRAYSKRDRLDEAQATLLDAERMAPEQVRYHFLSRQLCLGWIRAQRGKPSTRLIELAKPRPIHDRPPRPPPTCRTRRADRRATDLR
jgi:hypothetical protein